MTEHDCDPIECGHPDHGPMYPPGFPGERAGIPDDEEVDAAIRAGGAEPITDEDLIEAEIVEDDDLPEGVRFMTPAEEEWATWAMAQNGVDTDGRCNCGHEGMGVSWHTGDCRGANYALTRKVGELINRLHAESSHVERLIEANAANIKALDSSHTALATRLEAAMPDDLAYSEAIGWMEAVDTLRSMGRPAPPSPP
jgi:hypothetical protein